VLAVTGERLGGAREKGNVDGGVHRKGKEAPAAPAGGVAILRVQGHSSRRHG